MKATQAKLATPKGKAWEWAHSIWMVWSLVPWFNGAGFLYIAFRARQIKWLVWGLVYEIPLVLFLTFLHSPSGSWQSNTYWVSLILVSLASILHATVVRNTYLMALRIDGQLGAKQGEMMKNSIATANDDNIENAESTKREAPQQVQQPEQVEADEALQRHTFTEEMQRGEGVDPSLIQQPITPEPTETPMITSPESDAPMAATAEAVVTMQTSPPAASLPLATGEGLVDLNNASEADIAVLPSMGVISAKRAISEREALGGFQTLEQFGQKMGFKPHVIERMRHLVTLTPLKK